MKFQKFIRVAIVSISFLSYHNLDACGPFYDNIPEPDYFFIGENVENNLLNKQKQRNLLDWQRMTSGSIPLDDIERAVYHDYWDGSELEFFNDGKKYRDNKFYAYIKNKQCMDIVKFLFVAKKIEYLRDELNSRWYYPRHKWEDKSFDGIIEQCLDYTEGPLYYRYGLQIVRALFAAGRYAECVNFFKERFSAASDTCLMKEMATAYVAGCWSRLGETEKANLYFASVGQLYSMTGDKMANFKKVAELCPSSPDLLLFIQDEINRCGYYCYTKNDSLKTKNGLLPVIESIITKKEKPDNYAAFLFAASILEGDFNHNASRAKKYIKMAGKSADNPSLAEHIRAYRIKLDWSGGNLSNMPSDIKWLGSKIEPTSDECNYWNRILGNLVYSKAVPSLLRKGDTTRAIQLAGFADYLLVNQQDKPFLSYHWTNAGYVTKEAYSLYDERTNPLVFNEIDYGCYTFQLMNSLSPEAVIDYKRNLRSKSEIDRYLNAVARTDDDYLNELIGTLYLREADYENAEKYLSMVSPAYQYKLNTYVYLKRDPYTDRSDYQMKDYFENIYWGSNPEPTLSYMEDVKLNFARMMRKWKHDMAHLPDPNRRGLAQIRYAIGYINSFTVCWALTSYYKGWPDTRFDCTGCNGFICGLEDEDPDEITMKNVKLEYDRLVAGAMDMFDNPEYAAYANFLLHNYLTIAKHYGDTKIAKMLRAQCDSYGDWVAMTGGGSDI